jgi:hypothetical protein
MRPRDRSNRLLGRAHTYQDVENKDIAYNRQGRHYTQVRDLVRALELRAGGKPLLRNRCLGGVLISGEDRAGRSAVGYRRSVASIDVA